jgi:ADP-ribose pyrophosphatase YjhB (NUDIX family)
MRKEAAIVLIIRETDVPTFPVGYRREVLAVSSRKFTTMVLPGGTVDPGEIPMHTAIRELREEISVSVEPKDLVYVQSAISRAPAVAEDWLVHLFYARAIWGTPTHVEAGTELRWMAFDQFLESTVFVPFYRECLPEGIASFKSTKFLGTAAT